MSQHIFNVIRVKYKAIMLFILNHIIELYILFKLKFLFFTPLQ